MVNDALPLLPLAQSRRAKTIEQAVVQLNVSLARHFEAVAAPGGCAGLQKPAADSELGEEWPDKLIERMATFRRIIRDR
jgi:hypothetical protein